LTPMDHCLRRRSPACTRARSSHSWCTEVGKRTCLVQRKHRRSGTFACRRGYDSLCQSIPKGRGSCWEKYSHRRLRTFGNTLELCSWCRTTLARTSTCQGRCSCPHCGTPAYREAARTPCRCTRACSRKGLGPRTPYCCRRSLSTAEWCSPLPANLAGTGSNRGPRMSHRFRKSECMSQRFRESDG